MKIIDLPEEIESSYFVCLEEWNKDVGVIKGSAALDAWEMGVTTPSAWMNAWMDYRERALSRLPDDIKSVLEHCYNKLGSFEDTKKNGESVGREPEIKPIRLK